MIVEDRHFEYLRLQRGRIADLSGDRLAWQAAYEKSLDDDFDSMAPFLPVNCRALLDIGSGLGGIDAKLNRNYGGGVHVRLLDGLSDRPVLRSHRDTCNDMAVAADFLAKNGVEYLGCYSPVAGHVPADGLTYDVVISLQSWCFHYPPGDYLDFVKRRCGASTVVILDVRRDEPKWREELQGAFVEAGVALSGRKFDRVVFRAALT